jgi:threonyl-tRNA synthetase
MAAEEIVMSSEKNARQALAQEVDMGASLERVARQMDVAAPAGASGLACWWPAGMRLRDAVMDASWRMHQARGYQQVKSPSLAPLALFEQSGHAEKYAALMFEASGGSRQGSASLMLRPMSCPNHLSMYASRRRSVAELPWRVFEFGEVFRDEPSGSLAFLLRQRQFCQDDAHAVCLAEHVPGLAQGWLAMAREACEWMGCGEPQLRLASRPASRMGSDASWDQAESMLAAQLDACGSAWSWAPGDGAFYGPKIELAIKEPSGKSWQMGVFQLDMNLPERFGLRADGLAEGERLLLVHHAVFGSVERAVGVMLACLGMDLAPHAHPKALAVVAVSDKHREAARRFAAQAGSLIGSRCELMPGGDPLGVRIAKAKAEGWLRVAVVGAKEAQQAQELGHAVAVVNGAAVDAKQACEGLMPR